jgi:hypothetical protein
MGAAGGRDRALPKWPGSVIAELDPDKSGCGIVSHFALALPCCPRQTVLICASFGVLPCDHQERKGSGRARPGR